MRILIALERSEYAEIVLEHGLDQVARNPGAELHVITAIASAEKDDEARDWLEAITREGVESFRLADRAVVTHVRVGRPAPAIASLAWELRADLLVIGRFHVPSEMDAIVEIVDVPTLVIGIDGTVLEPQCPACGAVRRESGGEQLFCADHSSDRMPNLMLRVPSSTFSHSRMW